MCEDEDWVARELAEMVRDVPLHSVVQVGTDLFHATKAIVAIEASNAIVPLAQIRRLNGTAHAGFGQAGVVRADEYVSLTTSEARGNAYFDVLVAIAAIADGRTSPAQWLTWYLRRWGSPAELFEAASTEFDVPLAESLACLGITTASRPANEIQAEAVTVLSGLSVVQQLEWLFDLDKELMQNGDDQDPGLGIVEANPEAWSRVRLSDVALIKVQLSQDAMGYPHEDEEEVRVRGMVDRFEVIARGEERYADWAW